MRATLNIYANYFPRMKDGGTAVNRTFVNKINIAIRIDLLRISVCTITKLNRMQVRRSDSRYVPRARREKCANNYCVSAVALNMRYVR